MTADPTQFDEISKFQNSKIRIYDLLCIRIVDNKYGSVCTAL